VYERYVQLQACKYVDEILVYLTEEDLANLIMTQTMHIRFLGEEYKNKDFTGKQYCIENGIELYYHVRNHSYSTSELRQRTYELELQKKSEPDVTEYEQHSPKLLNKYYEGKTQ
jgi:glycerol-3-phosphate cytidylyltransferase